MPDNEPRNRRISPAEAMILTAENPANQEVLREIEEWAEKNTIEFRKDSEPIWMDLQKVGVYTDPPEGVLLSPVTSAEAVKVLIQHLNRPYLERVREALLRTLNTRAARGIAAKPLIEEYHRLSEADNANLRWVIGDTLSDIADDSVLDDIEAILRNKENGNSRLMFTLALSKMKNPKAVDVAMDMLDDWLTRDFEIRVLKRLKAGKARDKIAAMLNDPDPSTRKEAKKYLEKNF